MSAVKNPWRSEGRSLEEMVLYGMIDGLTKDDPEERVSAFHNPYAEWAGKPIEFCERFLEVDFTDDVKELLLSAQEFPETLGKSANSVGKTHAAACFIVYWFLVYADAMVFTLAAPPLENLELLLWGEIGSIVEKFPHLFAGFKVSLAGLHIERHKKSFITGLAIPQSANPSNLKARFSGKHAPHLLFVADEADGITAEIFEAINGCMSGGMARLLALFNPRAESGAVYLKEAREQANVVTLSALTHPNVVTGKDVIPGAVTQNVTIQRIHEQTVPLRDGQIPDTSCFVVPSYLEGIVGYSNKGKPYPPLRGGWRRVTSPEFSYMVLGKYPAQAESQLINSDWVEEANSRFELWHSIHGLTPPRRIRPFSSLDVADILGADTNVMTLFYGSWVPPQIVWNEEDVVKTGDIAADIYAKTGALWCKVDSTGVGTGAWAQMKRRKCVAYRIMVSGREDLKKIDKSDFHEEDLEGFENIRAQMLWGVREFFRKDKSAAVARDEELREELAAVKYWKDIRGRVCVSTTDAIKKVLRRSPDKLMSFALRFAVIPKEEDTTGNIGNYVFTDRKSNGRKRLRATRTTRIYA